MIEVINANVGLVAALFIAGAALGVIVARFTLPGPKRVAQLEGELGKAQKEHEDYRAGVTTHFKTTAELVGEMTRSYKAVYDHLADGAQSLCSEYDALTSSVFGGSRIIHDPKVEIGEIVVAAAATVAPLSTEDVVPAQDDADDKTATAAAAQNADSELRDTRASSDAAQEADTDAPEKTFSMGSVDGEASEASPRDVEFRSDIDTERPGASTGNAT